MIIKCKCPLCEKDDGLSLEFTSPKRDEYKCTACGYARIFVNKKTVTKIKPGRK